MNSVFRTWKIWVQFSQTKIKEKNQKKFQSSEVVQKLYRMSKRVLGRFFRKNFLPSVPWSHRNFSKKPKKFQNWRNAQNCSQNCPNLFWTCFVAFFSKKMPRVPWRVGFSKIFKILKVPRVVFKSVQTCFEHALRRFCRICLPSVPCRAFQIIWTWNKEFRFPKLKLLVEFADKMHNSHFFALPPESMYAIPFQIFWTENYEFRFPNSKIWVQFSGLEKLESSFLDLIFEVET